MSGIDPITAGINLLSKGLEVIFPDQEKRQEANTKLLQAIQKGELDLASYGRDVVVAEANGESWLQRNWRPVVMLFSIGMVGAHWFGFTAPNISDAVVDKLLTIVQLGLGGYVIGRSGEKMVKSIADSGMFKK